MEYGEWDDFDETSLDFVLNEPESGEKASFDFLSHFSSHHEDCYSKSKSSSIKRRRLPGPAGLLPKQVNSQSTLPIRRRDARDRKIREESNSSLLSQGSGNECEESKLLALAKGDCGPLIWPLVEKYTIANVFQLATQGLLPRGKIPVMCAFLDDVVLSPMDAKAVLRDTSGSVGCTIHRSVIKEYNERLANCSLLLLKQVSLFSPTGKKFYINITLSNVIRVYTSRQTVHSSELPRQHPDLQHTPLTKDELDALETECLRPMSPPASLIKSSEQGNLSPKRPNRFQNRPVSCNNSRENAVSSSDTSSYRLHSRALGSSPLKSADFRPAQLRPGLGSLVRTQNTPLSCITNTEQLPGVSSNPASSVCGLPTPVESILDDNMDDLLCSLADESQLIM